MAFSPSFLFDKLPLFSGNSGELPEPPQHECQRDCTAIATRYSYRPAVVTFARGHFLDSLHCAQIQAQVACGGRDAREPFNSPKFRCSDRAILNEG